MQAHKLSSYNTELSNSKAANNVHSCSERKIELVNGKTMLRSVDVEKTLESKEDRCANTASSGSFDFAGVAG